MSALALCWDLCAYEKGSLSMLRKHTSYSTGSDDGLWMSYPLAPLTESEAAPMMASGSPTWGG